MKTSVGHVAIIGTIIGAMTSTAKVVESADASITGDQSDDSL